MRKSVVVIVMVAVAGTVAHRVWAGAGVATDRCSYTGTQTRYATLADAQARTNPTGGPYPIPNRVTDPPYNTPYRDLGLWFFKDVPGYDDFNYFSTAWYYATSGTRYSGTGNPNNTGDGFIQIYDDDSSTDTSFIGYFDTSFSRFTLKVSGANATNPDEYTRLWKAAGEPNDRGTFHSYQLEITFGGLAGAWNPATGMYEATNHPTSVSGTFSAIFENTSAPNSFYVVDWTYGMDNWAYGQGSGLVGGPIDGSFFASDLAVPEPASMAMLVLGIPMVVVWRRLRWAA